MVGDSLDILPNLRSESIQCFVTSPPYWGLRDYDHSAQIGSEPSPIDGYARNGGVGKHGPNAIVGNTKKQIQKRNCKVPDYWGLKDRDLLRLAWRDAFALQEHGWILRSKITWLKKNLMPESVKNRPTSTTEEIFLFAKSITYYYNAEGIREKSGANLRSSCFSTRACTGMHTTGIE